MLPYVYVYFSNKNAEFCSFISYAYCWRL